MDTKGGTITIKELTLAAAFILLSGSACLAQENIPADADQTAALPAGTQSATGKAAFSSGSDTMIVEYPAILYVIDDTWQRRAFVVNKKTAVNDYTGTKTAYGRIKKDTKVTVVYITDDRGNKIALSIKLLEYAERTPKPRPGP